LTLLLQGGNVTETANRFHHRCMQDAPPMRPQYGCFSFDYLPDERLIRLHFANNDAPEPGVLSAERQAVRREELRAMFRVIQSAYPEAEVVISTSWIFHLQAFRRLLPPAFTARLRPRPNDYRSLGLWGQFLDRYGSVKEDLRAAFIDRLQAASDWEALEETFPFKELRAGCRISDFYAFCHVSESHIPTL
jgi:hypothetical protein